MITKNYLVVLMLMLLITTGCKKEKEEVINNKQEPPVTLGEMLTCHNTSAWDSTAIGNRLQGKWAWEYISCFSDPEKGNYDDFKGLVAEFKNDNSVEVSINGQINQRSTWLVQLLSDGSFGIITTPLVLQLPGRIFFCNERVLFSDSYTDGCDNYFKKQN